MLVLALAVVAQAATVRHAVVVGVNDGGGVLDPLAYAENDARDFAGVLVDLGDFDESLVTVLYAPTQEQLREALAQHAQIASEYPDDLFVFYYSGHADANGLRLGDETYWYDALKHDLRQIDSNVRVGVLDACRSGAITRLKGAGVTQSMFGEDTTTLEGEAWLTATSADEVAQESDQLRGGFFTHYLMAGMRGAADGPDGDGVVDLDELYRYTFSTVVAETGGTSGGTQHPTFDYRLTGQGDVALTDLRNASALLVLPGDADGKIAVFELPDKRPIAEVDKVPGEELHIALPEGRYLVRRRSGDQIWEVQVGFREGTVLHVDDWGTPRLPESAVARGEGADKFLASSKDYERRLNLGASPVVAGTASFVIPGAGQMYDRKYWKGAAYFGATSALMAGALFDPKHDFASGWMPVLGLGVWGASVADAVYGVHHREDTRPKLGETIGWSVGFGGADFPRHAGLSADVMLRPGLSLGFDRIGYTAYPDGHDWSFGSRLMFAKEGERWRPGGFVAMALRNGRQSGTDDVVTRAVFGVGGDLRYYVVPRYFLDTDVRFEADGSGGYVVGGVGMGVHLGR